MNKVISNCKRATFLVEKRMIGSITFGEYIGLRIHLLGCPKIVRDSMPFGNMATNEMGTYFIAYASTFTTVQKMLDQMFIGDPPGNSDRIPDFSSAKTGSLSFVPTFDLLDSL